MDNQYIPKGQKPVKKRRHTKPVVGEEPKEGDGKPEEDNEAEKDCGPEECGCDYQNGNEPEEGCKPDYRYPLNDDDDKPKPVVKKRRKIHKEQIFHIFKKKFHELVHWKI